MLDAQRTKKLTLESLAKAIKRHHVWTAAALYGQATCSAEEARTLLALLGLDDEFAPVLPEPPFKGRSINKSPLIHSFTASTRSRRFMARR
jgi:cyanate lyase